MRWSIERFAVALVAVVLAGCGSEPPAPPAGGDGDGAVRVEQGQAPNVRGLSVGLVSVSDDGTANFQVATADLGMRILSGRAGARLRAGGYTVEVVRVADSDDGGTAVVRVTWRQLTAAPEAIAARLGAILATG